MDFGIAKVLEGAKGPSTQSIGTLQYMSPEQIDAGVVDARTDLYALGLVLYEMCAGHPPFRSASPRELLNQQCTAQPPPLPADVRRGMPRGVEELVFALLAKSPEGRPASAADVVRSLAPFRPAEDVATSPRPETTTRDAVAKEEPSREPAAAANAPKSERLDTVALVAKNAAKQRELATWKSVLLIVLACAVGGLGTYALRLKAAGGASPQPSAEATAARR
jgi:serine/threonine-protein kinase